MSGFPRVPRLDAPTVLAELAEATGTVLTGDGACPGGEVGAVYVRWPDGHRSVLTSGAAHMRDLLEVARAHGVPAPRYELVARLRGGVAVVQELMPGAPPETVDRRVVESMVAVNRACRGLLAGRHDVAAPALYLLTDGPGYCLHGPAARYDRRTARLLAAVEEAGAAVPERLAGDDLVHLDFHPGNVLVDAAGRVTGVVDWDGAGRGDGGFDLFTLRFVLARRAPGLGRWLAGVLRESVAPDILLACWAHMSLRQVDWSIRHHTAADVTAWLDVAESLYPG